MIKAEVVFEDDSMSINGWYVYELYEEKYEINNGDNIEHFSSLEAAVKYCLENK